MSRRYRSLLWQWTRQLWHRPRPVEVEPLPRVAPKQVAITRGGHATMLVRYAELSILCDPLLDRFCKGVGRAEAFGIDEPTLAACELILISSASADHLHRPSLARLPRRATIAVPRGAARELTGLGFDRVLEIAPGQGFAHRGVEIATAPGRPDSILYVLRGDGPSVMFCGESGPTASFADLGDRFAPDVALLPIGGYSPRSFRRRHLTPSAALDAFEDLRARLFIPHRYGAFALSYEHLDDPERWLAAAVADRKLERYVEILRTGESQLLVPPRGRAQTTMGVARRPLGRTDDSQPDGAPRDDGSGLLDFEINFTRPSDSEADAERGSSDDSGPLDVNGDLAPPDESGVNR